MILINVSNIHMSYVHYTPFSVIALLIHGNIIFIHSLDQRYNINENIDGVILVV